MFPPNGSLKTPASRPFSLRASVPSCLRAFPKAFTLTELLVTIGIIAVLVAILVPTVSGVRNSANAARAQQIIASIASAIERYQGEFRAYPGPLANSALGPGIPSGITSPSLTGVTGSENLFLALTGGLTNTTTYDSQKALTSAGVLSPLSSPIPKKYGPYLEASTIANTAQAATPGRFADESGLSANDTAVPEYLDGFPTPLPILYLRANVGRPNVIDTTDGAQYNINQILGYTAVNLGGKTHTLSAVNATTTTYFENPSFPGQAKQKDGYILISAGIDRVYGTRDDITNFGGK